MQIFFEIVGARVALNSFLQESIYKDGLRTLQASSEAFLAVLEAIVPETPDEGMDWEANLERWRISSLKSALGKFEAVLNAELQATPLYYAAPKGGFDTTCLTDAGDKLFPSSLAVKVPSAVPDVTAATRCIAFELNTAAGFHLHRANEAVLRAYFDAVAGSANRPKTRNMGDYIKKLNELNKGDARVIAVLQSLKDLHRNPLMHPDDQIETVEDAISLYAAIRAAVGYMLISIPYADANVIALPQQAG